MNSDTSSSSSVSGVARTVMPSGPRQGGQSSSVLPRATVVALRGQQSPVTDESKSVMTALRMEMRAATVNGEDTLEEQVGERVVRILDYFAQLESYLLKRSLMRQVFRHTQLTSSSTLDLEDILVLGHLLRMLSWGILMSHSRVILK